MNQRGSAVRGRAGNTVPLAKSVSGSSGSSEHPLSPGYFKYNGTLARMESHAGRPKYWNGSKWVWVADIFDFDHHAHRIDRKKAENLAQGLNIKGAF